jgi:protein gp37
VWLRVLDTANGSGITAVTVKGAVEKYLAEKSKTWITLEEWDLLAPDEQTQVLIQAYSAHQFNKQDSDNIEWARWSWNPVTGCLHDCPYCYARDIADRFYPQGFTPTLHPDRLSNPRNTPQPDLTQYPDPVDRIGYRNVFVCSMADLFGKWVPAEWIEAVLRQAWDNPQWTFLFLTKFPIRMAEFDFPPNSWIGTTVDRQWAVERAEKAFRKIRASGYQGVAWLSCEPMLEQLTFTSLDMFDWIVMGGSSKSTQTPASVPDWPWLLDLWLQAKAVDLPVYMKTNLGIEQRVREYPE